MGSSSSETTKTRDAAILSEWLVALLRKSATLGAPHEAPSFPASFPDPLRQSFVCGTSLSTGNSTNGEGAFLFGCQLRQGLQFSLGTAKAHLRSILAKLQVTDRTEAAAEAYRRGLVS